LTIEATTAHFRDRLRGQELLLGCFGIELAAAAVPEALAQSNFDALIIDTEHSAFGFDQVSGLVTACRAAGLAALIRVSDGSRANVTRAADIWPDGLMFPGVETEEQARAAVEVAKYAPLGQRGVCPMLRYERLVTTRYATLNDQLALVLQVEGEAALSETPKIARVPGVDAIFVGVYDLSQSLGLPGQIEHPRVLEAGRQLRRELPETTALGVYVSSPAMARAWLEAGATFIAYATDALLLLAGCEAAARSVLAK
jgi:4-hydroxy-2-oxoheptanedioate aldolase